MTWMEKFHGEAKDTTPIHIASLVRPMSFISDMKTHLMSTAKVHKKIQENTHTEWTLMQLQGYPQLREW